MTVPPSPGHYDGSVKGTEIDPQNDDDRPRNAVSMLTQAQFLGTSGHQICHLLEELFDFDQAHFERVSAWGMVLVKAAHVEDVTEHCMPDSLAELAVINPEKGTTPTSVQPGHISEAAEDGGVCSCGHWGVPVICQELVVSALVRKGENLSPEDG